MATPKMRRTRDSVVPGELSPPYEVTRDFHKWTDALVHSCGWLYGATEYITCCKVRFTPTLAVFEAATCLKCMLCKGCPACTDGYIGETTMRMGKWTTKDGRSLYPFEMDNQHLVNAIKKLERDEEYFKDNWLDWLEVLEAEARLRGLP